MSSGTSLNKTKEGILKIKHSQFLLGGDIGGGSMLLGKLKFISKFPAGKEKVKLILIYTAFVQLL